MGSFSGYTKAGLTPVHVYDFSTSEGESFCTLVSCFYTPLLAGWLQCADQQFY